MSTHAKRRIDDGGSAFPLIGVVKKLADGDGYLPVIQGYGRGMTLRDWFAGHAMQGLLSAITTMDQKCPGLMSEIAYLVADGMLRQRATEGDGTPEQ